MPSAIKWVGKGSRNTLDGSTMKPQVDAGLIGVMDEDSYEGVNDTVHLNILITNPKYPKGNLHVDEIPQGATIFARISNQRTEKQLAINRGGVNPDAQQYVPREAVEVFTPEFLNYELHRMMLDNVGGSQGHMNNFTQMMENGKTPVWTPPTLEEVFQMFTLVGIMTNPPQENESYRKKNLFRLTTGLVVDISILATTQAINYHGPGTMGDFNAYLFWVLIEVPIQAKTQYVLNVNGSSVQELGNTLLNPVEMDNQLIAYQKLLPRAQQLPAQLEEWKRLNKTVKYVPKVVPRYSTDRKFNDSMLAYTITDDDGRPIQKTGKVWPIGKTFVNDYPDVTVAQNAQNLGGLADGCRNMEVASSQKPYTVQVDTSRARWLN